MDATGIMFALYHLSQVILVQVCVTLSSGLISTLVHWALEGYWSGLSQRADTSIRGEVGLELCVHTLYVSVYMLTVYGK